MDGRLMNFSDINGKLENALEVIMEHFSETEDRITDLEEEVERLRRALEEASG
jgi:predicted  nucleic acid-binding Zn-ribbon protein